MPENPHAEVYTAFQKYTENHQLTIEHDIDGHRTLHVGEPGTGMWSWRVITSPFYLTIVGDVADGFTFTRTFDMLDFFGRGDHPGHYEDGSPAINPQYWAEKLTHSTRPSVTEYSSKTAIRNLINLLDESEELGLDALAEYEHCKKIIDAYIAAEGIDTQEYLRRQANHQIPLLDFGGEYFGNYELLDFGDEYFGNYELLDFGDATGNYELPDVSVADQRAGVISDIKSYAELGEDGLRKWLSLSEQVRIFGPDTCWEDDFSEYTSDFIIACYAIAKTVSLYRQQRREHNAGDGFIVVEGGLVQNDTALPVYDMDVLDSDQSINEVFDEMFDLYERILSHGDHRRPAPEGLLAYLPEIEQKLRSATGDKGHYAPQMIADAQERYKRRDDRARRIE